MTHTVYNTYSDEELLRLAYLRKEALTPLETELCARVDKLLTATEKLNSEIDSLDTQIEGLYRQLDDARND